MASPLFAYFALFGVYIGCEGFSLFRTFSNFWPGTPSETIPPTSISYLNSYRSPFQPFQPISHNFLANNGQPIYLPNDAASFTNERVQDFPKVEWNSQTFPPSTAVHTNIIPIEDKFHQIQQTQWAPSVEPVQDFPKVEWNSQTFAPYPGVQTDLIPIDNKFHQIQQSQWTPDVTNMAPESNMELSQTGASVVPDNSINLNPQGNIEGDFNGNYGGNTDFRNIFSENPGLYGSAIAEPYVGNHDGGIKDFTRGFNNGFNSIGSLSYPNGYTQGYTAGSRSSYRSRTSTDPNNSGYTSSSSVYYHPIENVPLNNFDVNMPKS